MYHRHKLLDRIYNLDFLLLRRSTKKNKHVRYFMQYSVALKQRVCVWSKGT
jgi:hypothetical protein